MKKTWAHVPDSMIPMSPELRAMAANVDGRAPMPGLQEKDLIAVSGASNYRRLMSGSWKMSIGVPCAECEMPCAWLYVPTNTRLCELHADRLQATAEMA